MRCETTFSLPPLQPKGNNWSCNNSFIFISISLTFWVDGSFGRFLKTYIVSAIEGNLNGK